MEVEEETSLPTDQFIVPFFPHSVNVLCSATNSEKQVI
jgi:hypothetical protein